LGNVVAGNLSDQIGRRLLGIITLIVAPVMSAVFFNSSRNIMVASWVLSLFAQTAASTILNAYSAELFPTSHHRCMAAPVWRPAVLDATFCDAVAIQNVVWEFEPTPLRQPVFSFRDSLLLCVKRTHLPAISHSRSNGELLSLKLTASLEDFSLFALWAVDLACSWTWRLTLNKRMVVAGPPDLSGISCVNS
jgi:hypothetical protein